MDTAARRETAPSKAVRLLICIGSNILRIATHFCLTSKILGFSGEPRVNKGLNPHQGCVIPKKF
jgi:hypothetical protein